MYELELWNGINMPTREMGKVMTDKLPEVGSIFDGIKEQLKITLRVKYVWRTGCKIEEHIRYTVVVEEA